MWGLYVCHQYLGTRTQRARYRGKKCTADVTCDICKDLSVVQREDFLKKFSYSGCRKSRPSGSDVPTALPTLPLSASASSEAGRPSPPSLLPSLPSEGRGREWESEGVARVGSHGSPLPPPAIWWEGGGGGREGLGFWGQV